MTSLRKIPSTGLMGYEEAVQGGTAGALDVLDQGLGQAGDYLTGRVQKGIDRDSRLTRVAVDELSPYTTQGQQAYSVQAALSGALGPQAQAQAYQDFQESPGQAFLRERGEKAVLRNASALGGLGGGNVMKELVNHGIGMAAQDFNNHFARLGSVADKGFNATTMGADMLSQMGARGGAMRLNEGQIGAGLISGGVNRAADYLSGAGQMIGNARFVTGQNIADSIANTTQSVAGTQDGSVLADILGGNTQALTNLIVQSEAGDAQAKEQLAQLLANLAVQQGGSVAGLPGIPGIQETDGIIPRFLSSLPDISV